MTYDLHPIFVHFPIALLVLYSVIKILPLQKWFPAVSWKHIERTLLVCGVAGAFVALSTGETAERLNRPNRQLVEMHALFARTSTWLYGLLLLGELLTVLRTWLEQKLTSPSIQKLISFARDVLTNNALSRLVALLGLIAITVTGLLGGVMVYGLSADPFAGFVVRLLGITL